jgi:hypothetical protein
MEKSNYWDRALLPARRDGPCDRRTAKQRDELATSSWRCRFSTKLETSGLPCVIKNLAQVGDFEQSDNLF